MRQTVRLLHPTSQSGGGRHVIRVIRRLMALTAVLVAVGTPIAPAFAQYVPGEPGFIIDHTTIPVGGTFGITGQGCPPGSTVVFSLNGTTIGTAQASNDSAGTFSTSITLPSSFGPGTYTVIGRCGDIVMQNQITVTSGAAASGAGRTASTSGALPSTGADSLPYVRAGLVLVALGGLLVLATRRRRHSHSR
jgi:LPXTG-motif cell wall-anchored protein